MFNKFLFVQSLIIVLYSSSVQGNKPSQDELDRVTIDRTGCKYVSLGGGESVTYTRNSTSFSYLPLVAAEGNDTQSKFLLQFAIRADENVEVILFSKDHSKDNQNPHEPEYKIEFGLNGNDYSKITVLEGFDHSTVRNRKKKQRYTPAILSADEYRNFFISIDHLYFRVGRECEPFVTFSEYNIYRTDIVRVGFAAGSSRGARILYDCPANFAGCKRKCD